MGDRDTEGFPHIPREEFIPDENYRDMNVGLDPWLPERPRYAIIEPYKHGAPFTYVTDYNGRRLLRIPTYDGGVNELPEHSPEQQTDQEGVSS